MKPSLAPLRALLLLWAAFPAQAQTTFDITAIQLGDDQRVHFEVPSSPDRYYVLYLRPALDNPAAERPVAMKLGEPSRTVLAEPLGIGPSDGYYRVAELLRAAPADHDGDGRDDVTELLGQERGLHASFYPANPNLKLQRPSSKASGGIELVF